MPFLTFLALPAGVAVSVAQTRCIRAIADRRKLSAAWWDVAINALALAVIWEHDAPAWALFVAGSALGTWWST